MSDNIKRREGLHIEYLNKLKCIYEALCVVETKGMSTIVMGNCLVGLREIIDVLSKQIESTTNTSNKE